MTTFAAQLRQKIDSRAAVGGVVGLGYVGLPLLVEMARSGFSAIGLDVSQPVVDGINAGRSHVQDIPSEALAPLVKSGKIRATTKADDLRACDAISICVPTPLGKTKDPDLSYVVAAAEAIRAVLRPGQLVVLESTTYPGTTRELVLPILEKTGLKVGEDFFLCFSPERVDPGNKVWGTKNTPKVLGGVTPACLAVAEAFYGAIFDTIVPVQSAEAAELVKVYENTFRMI
ncbi:MAG: nucleotide sugar dehydrogenase, partial [Gemmatimonadales bacterium]